MLARDSRLRGEGLLSFFSPSLLAPASIAALTLRSTRCCRGEENAGLFVSSVIAASPLLSRCTIRIQSGGSKRPAHLYKPTPPFHHPLRLHIPPLALPLPSPPLAPNPHLALTLHVRAVSHFLHSALLQISKERGEAVCVVEEEEAGRGSWDGGFVRAEETRARGDSFGDGGRDGGDEGAQGAVGEDFEDGGEVGRDEVVTLEPDEARQR